MASKYWIANNPNSQVTDAEAQKVEELSATSVSVAELNLVDGSSAGTAVASKAVIYSANKGITVGSTTSGSLALGNTSQAAGVLTAKIDTKRYLQLLHLLHLLQLEQSH